VSPGTRFCAKVVKATKRPSAEIAGSWHGAFACAPDVATLARSVARL